jgi:hypothetical protein
LDDGVRVEELSRGARYCIRTQDCDDLAKMLTAAITVTELHQYADTLDKSPKQRLIRPPRPTHKLYRLWKHFQQRWCSPGLRTHSESSAPSASVPTGMGLEDSQETGSAVLLIVTIYVAANPTESCTPTKNPTSLSLLAGSWTRSKV